MQQFFNMFIDFVRQGVGAIFRFVQAIWMWAVEQVGRLLQQPFQDWHPWKLVILTVIAFGVGWYLYKAIWELWDAGQKILAALGTLMAVLIKTLPQVLIAGLIALARRLPAERARLQRDAPAVVHADRPRGSERP